MYTIKEKTMTELLFEYFVYAGKLYKYIDGKWTEVSFADSLKLTKIEGQVSQSTGTFSLQYILCE